MKNIFSLLLCLSVRMIFAFMLACAVFAHKLRAPNRMMKRSTYKKKTIRKILEMKRATLTHTHKIRFTASARHNWWEYSIGSYAEKIRSTQKDLCARKSRYARWLWLNVPRELTNWKSICFLFFAGVAESRLNCSADTNCIKRRSAEGDFRYDLRFNQFFFQAGFSTAVYHLFFSSKN